MRLQIQSEDRQQVYLAETFPDEFYTGKGTEERRNTITREESFCGDARTILFNGVSITHGQFTVPKRLNFYAEFDKPVIEMHFTLSGMTRVAVEGGRRDRYVFDEHHHNLTFAPSFHGMLELLSAGEFRMFEVNFTRKYFERVADSGSVILDRMMNAMVRGEEAQASARNLVITPSMRQVIHSIESSAYVGASQKLFLESKVLELFAMQLEQLENEHQHSSRRRYTSQELRTFQEARLLLLADLRNPPTIARLSQLTGVNDFKLKQGFRDVFGNTVFGTLTDARMEEAYTKLQTGVMNVNEVATHVGYSNASHFAVAFKRKYGFLPGKVKPTIVAF